MHDIIIELKTFTGFLYFKHRKKVYIILRVIENITCMKEDLAD